MLLGSLPTHRNDDRFFSPYVAPSRFQTKMSQRLPHRVGVAGISRAPYGVEVQWGKIYKAA